MPNTPKPKPDTAPKPQPENPPVRFTDWAAI